MKIFKLRVSDTDFFELSKREFETQTHMMAPWFNHQAESERHFAVCTACNNTIQILHLYNETQTLHGKHNLRSSVGLQDRSTLLYCPHYSKRPALTPESRRRREDTISSEVRELLIDHFDRVVYFIKQTLGLRYPDWRLQDMLSNYLNSRGWLYSGANLINIPWIFLYQSRAQNMVSLGILNEKIRDAITAYNDKITFNKYHNLERPEGEHIELNVSFVHHSQTIIQHEIIETLELQVIGSDNYVVYSEVVNFEHDRFVSLMNSNNEIYRDSHQVELARQILG